MQMWMEWQWPTSIRRVCPRMKARDTGKKQYNRYNMGSTKVAPLHQIQASRGQKP